VGAATGADDGAADDGVAVKTWEGWSDGRRVIVVGEGDEGARDGTVPCVGGCVVTAGCVGRGVGRGSSGKGEGASVVIVVGEGDEGATVPCVGGCVVTAGRVGRGVGRETSGKGEGASVVAAGRQSLPLLCAAGSMPSSLMKVPSGHASQFTLLLGSSLNVLAGQVLFLIWSASQFQQLRD
jgi:hypothetical protein